MGAPNRTPKPYPQADVMADESMVRTLRAQVEAIWPQEEPILRRRALPASARILDLACGTGEFAARVLAAWPGASLVGVDLEPAHVERARAHCREFGERAEFKTGNAYALDLPDAAFDLGVCRHLLQAIQNPAKVVDELIRVVRPGGRLHLVVEDYGMIHFHPTASDSDAFWRRGPMRACRATGSDLLIGRKMFELLSSRSVEDVAVDYVVVDTLRVPRETFARIWEAWRDGYAEFIARNSEWDLREVTAGWNDMIACLRDGKGYGCWMVPVWSAKVRTGTGRDRP